MVIDCVLNEGSLIFCVNLIVILVFGGDGETSMSVLTRARRHVHCISGTLLHAANALIRQIHDGAVAHEFLGSTQLNTRSHNIPIVKQKQTQQHQQTYKRNTKPNQPMNTII